MAACHTTLTTALAGVERAARRRARRRANAQTGLAPGELATLGRPHADEHGPSRGVLKIARPVENAEPSPSTAKLLRSISHDPSVSGRWTTKPFPIPTFAIQAALLPTGDVISWGYPAATSVPRPNLGKAFLWDPRKGTGRASLLSIAPPTIDAGDDGTPATDTTGSIALGSPLPGWKIDAARLNLPRSYMNALVLPTGDMLVVGGGKGKYGALQNYAYRSDGASKHVEIRDRSSGCWRLGAAQRKSRAYHSTAVLLPDGRVWSAGDDYSPTNKRDTAEIYSPPYLFRGPRPKITAALSDLTFGQRFDVSVAGPGAHRAVLMAPNAITHATEMNARHIRVAARPGDRLRTRQPRAAERGAAGPKPRRAAAR